MLVSMMGPNIPGARLLPVSASPILTHIPPASVHDWTVGSLFLVKRDDVASGSVGAQVRTSLPPTIGRLGSASLVFVLLTACVFSSKSSSGVSSPPDPWSAETHQVCAAAAVALDATTSGNASGVDPARALLVVSRRAKLLASSSTGVPPDVRWAASTFASAYEDGKRSEGMAFAAIHILLPGLVQACASVLTPSAIH
jgi:hypothetical protein